MIIQERDFAHYGGDLLLCWGIFNPYGPTLSCIGRLHTDDPNVHVLFFRSLNPFHQESAGIATLTGPDRGDVNKVCAILRERFSANAVCEVPEQPLPLIAIGVPSFVLIPWANPEFQRTAPALFVECPAILAADLGSEIGSINRYRGRPWDRATDDQNVALAGVRFGGAPPLQARNAPVDSSLATQWFGLINDPVCLDGQLAAFPEAWNGAIAFQALSGVSAPAYGFEQLNGFLERFGYHVFRDAARVRIEGLIHALNALRDAIGAGDADAGRAALGAVVKRLVEVYGDDGKIAAATMPVLAIVERDMRTGNPQAALEAVLTLLARFGEARSSLG